MTAVMIVVKTTPMVKKIQLSKVENTLDLAFSSTAVTVSAVVISLNESVKLDPWFPPGMHTHIRIDTPTDRHVDTTVEHELFPCLRLG